VSFGLSGSLSVSFCTITRLRFLVGPSTFPPPSHPRHPLSCLGVIVIVSITPAIGHVIALGTNRTTDLTIDHAVDLAITNIAVAIGIAVPPVIIRAIPLVVGHVVVPGVAGVHTDLLGIGPGVRLGLAPIGVVLISTLATMALGVCQLSLLFLPRLLWIRLLLSLRPLSVRLFPLYLSDPLVSLLMVILREEYFKSPPGWPCRLVTFPLWSVVSVVRNSTSCTTARLPCSTFRRI